MVAVLNYTQRRGKVLMQTAVPRQFKHLNRVKLWFLNRRYVMKVEFVNIFKAEYCIFSLN